MTLRNLTAHRLKTSKTQEVHALLHGPVENQNSFYVSNCTLTLEDRSCGRRHPDTDAVILASRL